MYVTGNTGWTITKDHHLSEDGVDTYFNLGFKSKDGTAVTVLMSTRQLKAFTAQLVLEVNEIDPFEEAGE